MDSLNPCKILTRVCEACLPYVVGASTSVKHQHIHTLHPRLDISYCLLTNRFDFVFIISSKVLAKVLVMKVYASRSIELTVVPTML